MRSCDSSAMIPRVVRFKRTPSFFLGITVIVAFSLCVVYKSFLHTQVTSSTHHRAVATPVTTASVNLSKTKKPFELLDMSMSAQQAIISMKLDGIEFPMVRRCSESGHLNVIIQLFAPGPPHHSFRDPASRARFKEYADALQLMLVHDEVRTVHVLHEQERDVWYWRDYAQLFDPCHRLSFFRVHQRPLYSDLFLHANQHFSDQVVLITHSDVIPGEGFHDVTTKNVRGKLLALSRWGLCPEEAHMCSVKGYVGSHDAFVLVPPVPPQFIERVAHRQNVLGAENVLIWEARSSGRLAVFNPCLRVRTYHLHCTNLRKSTNGKTRINNNGRSGEVAPTVDFGQQEIPHDSSVAHS